MMAMLAGFASRLRPGNHLICFHNNYETVAWGCTGGNAGKNRHHPRHPLTKNAALRSGVHHTMSKSRPR
jgi:hypothetical protein